jgi:hypothetical protein
VVKRRASNSAIALPESGGRPLTALDQAQLELMQAGNGTSVGASAVSSSIKCHVDVRCEVSSGESHRISFELPNAAAANEVDAPSCPALPPPSTLHRAASRGSDQLRLPPSSDARSNCAGADIGRTLRQGGAQLLPREAFDPSSAGQNPPPLPPAALHPTASPHDKTPLAQSGSALAKPLSCAGIPAAARPLGTTCRPIACRPAPQGQGAGSAAARGTRRAWHTRHQHWHRHRKRHRFCRTIHSLSVGCGSAGCGARLVSVQSAYFYESAIAGSIYSTHKWTIYLCMVRS